MKVHLGTDTQGLVHSLVTTDAARADINQLGNGRGTPIRPFPPPSAVFSRSDGVRDATCSELP
jgi:hypothetical protein